MPIDVFTHDCHKIIHFYDSETREEHYKNLTPSKREIQKHQQPVNQQIPKYPRVDSLILYR